MTRIVIHASLAVIQNCKGAKVSDFLYLHQPEIKKKPKKNARQIFLNREYKQKQKDKNQKPAIFLQ